jgi:hypothetical protein
MLPWAALFVVIVALLPLNARLATVATAAQDKPAGQLTDDEKKAGWKLLFDGTSTAGWHTFRRTEVRPGWQVKDGAIVCADPRNAGDLCTDAKYDWFELSIEYTISEAGNSGILFHVTDEGRSTWNTGPELQLEDNEKAADQQRCGWLYQLYKTEVDPKTNKPLDTTKPVGQWNHIRLVVAKAPAKSEVVVNGTKYYDFVYNGDDFKARVAKSKFALMAGFAKSDSGYIALQGDHGQVSFRNIKLRPLTGGTVAPVPAKDDK